MKPSVRIALIPRGLKESGNMRVRRTRQAGSRGAARLDLDFVPASELLKAERQAGPDGPQRVEGAQVAASIAQEDDPKKVGRLYLQYVKDHPEARPPGGVVSLDNWHPENAGSGRVITVPGSPLTKGRRQRPKSSFGFVATLGRFDSGIVPAPTVVLATVFSELKRPEDAPAVASDFGPDFPACLQGGQEIVPQAPVKVEFVMLPEANTQVPFADETELTGLRRLQIRVPSLPTHPKFKSPMTDQEVRTALLILERGALTYSADPKDRAMALELEELLEFTTKYREAEQARKSPRGPF